MKKVMIIVGLVFLVTYFNYVCPAPDCMDNSWHMKKKYDNKTYHHVHCNCPCGKGPAYLILSDRGKCIKCGHYRDPRPYIFATARMELKKEQPVIDIRKLQALVKNRQKKGS